MKLPKGSNIRPDKTENFYVICRELGGDFNGALRLKGKTADGIYMADLLIQDGKIIAASIKRISDDYTWNREEGLSEIQDKLAGSSGKLDIFEFTPEEMARSIEHNEKSLLTQELLVVDIGVKIKSKVIKQKPEKPNIFEKIKSFFRSPSTDRKADRLGQIKESRIPESPGRPAEQLRDHIRPRAEKQPEKTTQPKQRHERAFQTPEDQSQDPEHLGSSSDIGKLPDGPMEKDKHRMGIPSKSGSDITKDSRLHAIKEKRMQKIEKVMQDEAKATSSEISGKKIETNIDKLYELVINENVIKINDTLSNQLNVEKTQIEEWAMILEEHNLVELHYPTIGEPEIRSINTSKR